MTSSPPAAPVPAPSPSVAPDTGAPGEHRAAPRRRARLRAYVELARRAAQRSATYRAATAAGIFTNTVFALLNAAVLVAVMRSRGEVNGFGSRDALTFVFCAQGLLMVSGAMGGTELADRITSGDVVVDLYRPLDLQWTWLADAVGRSAFYVVFRGVPPVLVGSLLFDLALPSSPGRWAVFAVSVVLAVVIGFAYRFLLQSMAFWLLDVRGPNQIGWMVAQFLAGMVVPVFLFPEPLRSIALALPFVGMVELPAEIFVGKHPGVDVLSVLAHQAVWAVVLLVAGRIVLRRAVRKVVVQGG